MFDYLIVGAGFAGSVLAERLAQDANKQILIVDSRTHIGGNAYDHYNEYGLLIHRYGPHIFHTNSKEVFEYLSRFTEWRQYQHTVLASVDGQLLPIPINLNTINQLYGLKLNCFEVEGFLESVAEKKERISTSEDVVVNKVGRELYRKFFQGYTRKQWGLDPSELDSTVTARVPTRTNCDNRYFTDNYQAMPIYGFTAMFENILKHKNIKIMLNTNYREIKDFIPYKEVIYTGPIDEFFDYRFGKLPYRSLDFKHETIDREIYQQAPVINYPNDYLYSRVTEFKYLTGQSHSKTAIVYEYPKAEGDPYYPIPKPENTTIYQHYKELADNTKNVYFVGRLATYKYYNMDQVVAQALTLYSRLKGKGEYKMTIEIWGGIECTYNRVQDQYFDQLEFNGHLYRSSDLELFAELGIKKLRYPVSWERIAPNGLKDADWAWTDERLIRLRELGIEPIAGLVHHGSGPKYTSLIDPLFGQKFAEFALSVAERYPWLEYYTPINEPLTTARFSGLYGHWYPHGKDSKTFLTALIAETEATILAMREIRRVNPKAKLIQTEDLGKTFSTALLQYQADFENERRWLSFDLLCGFIDENHPLYNYLLQNGIAAEKLDWIKENKCSPNIIGLNHYLTSERYLDEHLEHYPACSHGGNGKHQYADIEAIRVCPDLPGLKGLLGEVINRYSLPIAITEIHLGCTRDEQIRWLKEVWESANTLKEEGSDIMAITAWSMLGSYDWNNLVTSCNGFYEPGIYDISGSVPRETALAKVLKELIKGRNFEHLVLNLPGWWKRPERLIYNSPYINQELTNKKASFEALLKKSSVQPILITGGRGTLGKAFARICELRALPYISLNREDLDITDYFLIKEVIGNYSPWAVINAAGYVRVDEAERDFQKCYRENINGAVNLATVCESFQIPFVNFSSDLVFGGNKESFYLESDLVNPLNVYGKSKAEAEKQVFAINPTALIIRTSAFFGPWDSCNFITMTLEKVLQGERVQVANDLIVSPTYVPDLVNACLDILIDGETGLWHLVNQGEISWFNLALKVLKDFDLPQSCLEEKSASEIDFLAQRPKYSALGSEKAKLMPSLENALQRYRAEVKLNSSIYA